jgi:hypothetical protein
VVSAPYGAMVNKLIGPGKRKEASSMGFTGD